MSDQAMVNLTIDGVPVSVPKGTLLVEAAKTVKQEIPVYCYHPKLGPAGLCRVCLVEIEGMPKLQIACNTPVSDGMIVHTQNEKVDTGRGMIIELLLVNHPLDCPICDKGGECDLQDYAMAYARGTSDSVDPKSRKPKGVDLGPTIVLDEERCVVCQRCVRFDDIIAGEEQLVVKDRGVHDIIATATGDPYHHNFTGNVTEICPVGALTSKTYRFKSRPWDLHRTQTSCTQCSVGCQMFSDVRYDIPLRTMSVEHDDAISDGWLCDRGRYNIGFYASPERLIQPMYKKHGTFVQIGWDDAFAIWAKAIKTAIHESATLAGAIGGGRLTNEEAYVMQHLFRAQGVANLDWRAGSQRQATPGTNGGTIVALENAKTIVIAGESPEERAPVLWLRILKAMRRGAKLVTVATAEEARASAGDASPVALIWDGADLAVGRAYAKAFDSAATYITGEQGNARGAEAMGVSPAFGPGYAACDAGRDSFAMLDDARNGKLNVLSIFGVNPALYVPGAKEALAALDFLAVSELFMTETAQLATLVLPAKGAFEKHGTMLNLAGDLLPVNASLNPPDGTLSDLEMLVALAQQFDMELPSAEDVDRAVVAHAANASIPFSFGDERFATAAASAPSAGKTIFSGGGTSKYDIRLEALHTASALDAAVFVPEDQAAGVNA
jgi:NADH-quinone oxidoreductase subunit G